MADTGDEADCFLLLERYPLYVIIYVCIHTHTYAYIYTHIYICIYVNTATKILETWLIIAN